VADQHRSEAQSPWILRIKARAGNLLPATMATMGAALRKCDQHHAASALSRVTWRTRRFQINKTGTTSYHPFALIIVRNSESSGPGHSERRSGQITQGWAAAEMKCIFVILSWVTTICGGLKRLPICLKLTTHATALQFRLEAALAVRDFGFSSYRS
jgi:hypothetical protein